MKNSCYNCNKKRLLDFEPQDPFIYLNCAQWDKKHNPKKYITDGDKDIIWCNRWEKDTSNDIKNILLLFLRKIYNAFIRGDKNDK